MVANLSGQVFGRLVVLEENGRTPAKKVVWLARCQCGKLTKANTSSLRSGHTRSCGCLGLETKGDGTRTHGKSKSVEHRTWTQMRDRCNNPNNPAFSDYGGKGIRVCKRWDSFENFLADMGPRPEGKFSIERLDFRGNYGPKNCVWLPLHLQAQNRRNVYKCYAFGKRYPSVAALAREVSLPYSSLVAACRENRLAGYLQSKKAPR